MTQVRHVHVRDDEVVLEQSALGAHAAVLGDEVMPGVHGVRGGLAPTRVGVHVSAAQPRGLHGDERAAVVRLGDGLVGRGRIAHDQRARERVARGGAVGHPQILAYLRRDGDAAARGTEEQSGAERAVPFGQDDVLARIAREHTRLIELRVARHVRLGHDAQDAAAADEHRAAVQLAAREHGRAQDDQHVLVLGRRGYLRERGIRAFDQPVQQEQVARGVARHAQLGQHEQPHFARVRPADQSDYLLCVGRGVAQPDVRRRRRHFVYSVFHILLLSVRALSPRPSP